MISTNLPSYVHTNSNKQDKKYYTEQYKKYYEALDGADVLNIEVIMRLVISYLFIPPIVGANEWFNLAGVTVSPYEKLPQTESWWQTPLESLDPIKFPFLQPPPKVPKKEFSYTLIPSTVNSEPLTLTVFKKLVEDKWPNITLKIDPEIMERKDINSEINQPYWLALPKSILRNKQGENQDLNFEAISSPSISLLLDNLAKPLEAVISIVMQNILHGKQCTISMTTIPKNEHVRCIRTMIQENPSRWVEIYYYPIAISVSYGMPQSLPRSEGLKIRRLDVVQRDST